MKLFNLLQILLLIWLSFDLSARASENLAAVSSDIHDLNQSIDNLQSRIEDVKGKIRTDEGTGLLNKRELIHMLLSGYFFQPVSLYPIAVLSLKSKSKNAKALISGSLRSSTDLVTYNNAGDVSLILPQTLDIETVSEKVMKACPGTDFLGGRICYKEEDLTQWEIDQLKQSSHHGSSSYYIDREPFFSLMFVDIDHFKEHFVEGDELLVQIASLYRRNFRSCNDKILRFGGDEMVFFLPRVEPEIAHKYVAPRLRALVEGHTFTNKSGENIRLTISVGVSGAHGILEDKGFSVLAAADRGIYEAKKSDEGGNEVVFISPSEISKIGNIDEKYRDFLNLESDYESHYGYATEDLEAKISYLNKILENLRQKQRIDELNLLKRSELTRMINNRTWTRSADSKKDKNCLSMIFVDIDSFKDLNRFLPAHHLDGDQILIQLSNLYQSFFGDIEHHIFRYWGDQTVLVLPGTSPDQALGLARDLMTLIQTYKFLTLSDEETNITVSIGVSGALGPQQDGGLAVFNAAKNGVLGKKESKSLSKHVIFVPCLQ